MDFEFIKVYNWHPRGDSLYLYIFENNFIYGEIMKINENKQRFDDLNVIRSEQIQNEIIVGKNLLYESLCVCLNPPSQMTH